ncbi:(d)CMP kinase [Calidifontibacillus erzurumensis]|uniref:Cytidylate kinase n=1 Tax=Calidifontibacillus erzurumensis TaxID=2741433 RepID=A0A8J8GFR5_9BACI|nr:(d)CMP kinase [Calidifontibacillus erzurumensis]NSL52316.1 (d)CMP kinase [Calidifontibacillus erzurumensis]
MRKINVAIDGPAAAGKSTVARKIAEKCSFTYIDTGAMYRALTYKALQKKINLEDEQKLTSLLMDTNIHLEPANLGGKVFVDGVDVTKDIRNNEVTNAVPTVAKHPGVRQLMVQMQQELAKEGGVVMDGRDIGTHVLPNAEVKIFMIASVEERANRRFQENIQKGIQSDLEKLKEEISLRDKLDSERETAPLLKADDAIEIDTTSLTIDEVVAKIIEIIKERS